MNQKLSVFSLLSVIFIDSVGWGVVYPVFAAYFFNNRSYANADIRFETAIAVYSIFMFFFSPVLGALSDQYGRKKLMLISMVGTGLGFAISATGIYLKSLFVLLLGRAVSGMAAGNLGISQAAIVDISTDHDKAYRLGLIALANGLGFTCGPLIGGLLIKATLTLYIPLIFICLLTITGALGIYFLFNDTPRIKHTAEIDLSTSIKNILGIKRFHHQRRMFASFFLAMLGYITFFNYLPLLLHTKFNFSGNEQGYFLAYYAIIFSLSLMYIFPKVIKYMELMKLVTMSIILHILFYQFSYYADDASLMYLTILPIALSAPIIYVGIVTLISSNSNSDDQGKIMGIIGSICALTWALGPLIVATLIKANFEAPVMISTCLLLFGLFHLNKSKELREAALISK